MLLQSIPALPSLVLASAVDEEPPVPAAALHPIVLALPAAAAAPHLHPTPQSQETAAAITRMHMRPAAATAPPAGDRLSPEAADGVRTRTEALQTAAAPAVRLTAVSMATKTTIPRRPMETPGSALKRWE